MSLHDLSCPPEDVQNYIDRSLLLTHGFVPIIEASQLQRVHDDHELIMLIEMLLDVIRAYVILYMLCLEDLLFIYQYSRTRRWRKFQKGKIYNAEEHVAIESFVTTLIH